MVNSPWTDPSELSDGSKNKAKARCSPKMETCRYGKSAKGKSPRFSQPASGKMSTQGKAPSPGKPKLPKRK